VVPGLTKNSSQTFQKNYAKVKFFTARDKGSTPSVFLRVAIVMLLVDVNV